MINNIINTYAAYSKDEKVRLKSSSGAIFSHLAEQIVTLGGLVYGVAMSDDCRSAEYIRVDSKANIDRLRGSKYIQAKIGNIYQAVKKDLENGKWVLFTGTGCQINGLLGFLGKNYNSLVCVDVVCHGVPSPALWRKYVSYLEEQYNEKLRTINFRCKDYGWIDFGVKRMYTNKVAYVSKDMDPYMQMFLRNYSLRPSCYECSIKMNKKSDLSIADFWGIEHVVPEMNDGKGTSLVIVRTQRGNKAFNAIKEKIVIKEVSYEEGIKENSAEYISVSRPVERESFFNDVKQMTFFDLEEKYAKPLPVSFKQKIKNKIKKYAQTLLYRNS